MAMKLDHTQVFCTNFLDYGLYSQHHVCLPLNEAHSIVLNNRRGQLLENHCAILGRTYIKNMKKLDD